VVAGAEVVADADAEGEAAGGDAVAPVLAGVRGTRTMLRRAGDGARADGETRAAREVEARAGRGGTGAEPRVR
jgi:hypothetical protein